MNWSDLMQPSYCTFHLPGVVTASASASDGSSSSNSSRIAPSRDSTSACIMTSSSGVRHHLRLARASNTHCYPSLSFSHAHSYAYARTHVPAHSLFCVSIEKYWKREEGGDPIWRTYRCIEERERDSHAHVIRVGNGATIVPTVKTTQRQ
jgi:hypothetical protein